MLRPVVLFGLAALVVLPASGQSKIGRWSEQSNDAWWALNVSPETWAEEKRSIHQRLLAIHKRLGTAQSLSNPHFTGWMNHLKWLSLFPHNWEQHPFFKEGSAQSAYTKLAMAEALRDAFLGSLSPYDDHPRALEILCRIYRAHPAAAADFPALAVAISLVFDQPFPAGWPHHFVDHTAVPRTDENPEDRFAFYVRSQKGNGLFYDLRRLSVADLKFVVDTPISLAELKFVQGVRLRDVKQLHALFSMIRYDLPRLEKREYVWPHGRYELASIAQHGGLCVDQAYYTAHAAKAKGVPNIVFLGQGNSGEHAWLGYLENYGLWKFDLAKFRNEDYPVGQAFDPQTWRRLTDSECSFLNRHSARAPGLVRARHALTWAELNPTAEFRLDALREARKSAPQYLWAWELEADHLATTKAGVAASTRFWNDWIHAFRSQKDLRFRGEKRLLGLLDEAGQTSEYNRLLGTIITANKSQRFDLVVSVAAEKVFVHIENKRWDDAHRTFRSAMQKLASKAGGHLFYQLVQPYAQSCLEEGKTTYAQEAMQRARKAFKAQAGSILDKDLKELEALVKAKAG